MEFVAPRDEIRLPVKGLPKIEEIKITKSVTRGGYTLFYWSEHGYSLFSRGGDGGLAKIEEIKITKSVTRGDNL